MTDQATLTIDLTKIAENTRRVVEAMPGVDIVAVTKVCAGSPEVGAAMLAGGASALAESRLENVARLRTAGITAPIWLLRPAPAGLADEVVRTTQVSLASEVMLVLALDRAAGQAGLRHSIVAMVDLGDLREGMMPADLPAFLACVEAMEYIDVVGIGLTLSCYGGITPTADNLGELVELAEAAETQLGRRLLISGGTSSTIDAFIAGQMPERIDNLRMGEAIVMGVSPLTRERVLELHTDALTLSVSVIECKVKPSKPRGIAAQDAFGNKPVFEDRGLRRRAICAIGRQDTPPEGLVPLDSRIRVLGASSDHLILDVEDLPAPLAVGESIEFRPGYSAALALCTSEYVRKVYVGGE